MEDSRLNGRRQMLGGFDDFPEFMQTPEGQEIYNDLKIWNLNIAVKALRLK